MTGVHAKAHVWKSEGNSVELLFLPPSHRLGTRLRSPGLSSKYLLSHLALKMKRFKIQFLSTNLSMRLLGEDLIFHPI